MSASPIGHEHGSGWTLVAHPLFLGQVAELAREVARLRLKDAASYRRRNATKRLAAILKLALEVIPEDPSRAEFRLGDALGKEHTHWRRAKFFQQYRLFFRYDSTARVIAYAWVNDEDTRRAYERASDAYRVFGKMLVSGNPPDSWDALCKASRSLDALSALDEGLGIR